MAGEHGIPVAPFRWRDGERLIVFGRGRVSEARDLIRGRYVLLSTPRATPAAPGLPGGASAVHDVPSGRVDEVAGQLRSAVEGETLVALGGGRVIDVAKALAAADPPRRVVAIPTTLSGAEMSHGQGEIPADTRILATRGLIDLHDIVDEVRIPKLFFLSRDDV